MLKTTKLMAKYNHWMNERLFDAASTLPDEARKQDRGAFFGSIHATLNHILLADEVWMARFRGETFAVTGLGQELHAELDALRTARRELDEKIVAWADSLTATALASELCYARVSSPEPKRLPLWIAAQHFFNHQTHHRGQITTLLTQVGVDVGVTDLVWFAQHVGLER